MTGADWLAATAAANKLALENDDLANGYLATYNTATTSADAAFWVGARTMPVDANGNTIQYVTHRMCALQGAYNKLGPDNSCVQTTPKSTGGTSMQTGSSGAIDGNRFNDPPQVHYVITARISGPRGGNVVNQLVVTIGV
jgi:hypothetical protein